MTYVLVCVLCAATLDGAPRPEPAEGVPAALAPSLELRLAPQAVGSPQSLVVASPLPLADQPLHDGGSGSHLGPMWIMMGIMMVGMMVALGVYMMRGASGDAFEIGGASAPHLAAIPVGAGFRPGG